ncbi:MAG: redox-regulated ATPase YchF [Syntrophomonadaceae bacterium]|nr:redox-regulated ATPase YchF [Syntrophomonadaceae bacterium]
MQLGIIGMPSVGKTTIFELLSNQRDKTNSQGKANTAIARIPDVRIDKLSTIFKPKKTTYAQLELVDIPGLVPGVEKGSHVFLDSVRKADALLHVVRLFQNDAVPYIYENIDPMRDIEMISYELLLADLDLIEKRIERIETNKKKNQMLKELELLERLKTLLEDEKPISSLQLDQEEQLIMSTYQFLTNKPLLICLNLGDDDLASLDYMQKNEIAEYSKNNGIPVVEVAATIEKEISELDEDEKEEFLKELGIKESGLLKVSHSMYQRLGLISFFTVGEDEVKAWTIEQGTPARKAAGKIHSDIERGFIRAEVVEYNDFIELGSMNAVKEKGLFRLEGKEYIVKDGDIVHFRFNV